LDELLEMPSVMGVSVSAGFIASLSSVLSGGNDGRPVQAIHPTFLEYIQRPQQSNEAIVRTEEAESLVAQGCLKVLLSDQLKYDICGIRRPLEFEPENKSINDVEGRLRTRTTVGLRYATVHGLSHVSASLRNKVILGMLLDFYKTKMPYWVELMSLLGKISFLILSTQALKRSIEGKMNERNIILVSFLLHIMIGF
jgi:hypothetical protein